MDYAAVVFLEILYMIAFLALTSAGLAIVFGMMRVINLAHGEFLMLGGYAAITAFILQSNGAGAGDTPFGGRIDKTVAALAEGKKTR